MTIKEPNKKFSSVEWLSNQTYELFEQYSEGNFDRIQLNKLMLKATEQAKQMHKDEIVESMSVAFIDGANIGGITYESPYEDWEQYYNETFQ